MLIKELKWQGIGAWPPQWADSSHIINENAILSNVRPIVGTDLLRIDVEHNGIPHLGVMFADREVRETLCRRLKENLGRRLAEVADLEIDLDQEVSDLPARAD
jgi:hypothetical protein